MLLKQRNHYGARDTQQVAGVENAPQHQLKLRNGTNLQKNVKHPTVEAPTIQRPLKKVKTILSHKVSSLRRWRCFEKGRRSGHEKTTRRFWCLLYYLRLMSFSIRSKGNSFAFVKFYASVSVSLFFTEIRIFTHQGSKNQIQKAFGILSWR